MKLMKSVVAIALFACAATVFAEEEADVEEEAVIEAEDEAEVVEDPVDEKKAKIVYETLFIKYELNEKNGSLAHGSHIM